MSDTQGTARPEPTVSREGWLTREELLSVEENWSSMDEIDQLETVLDCRDMALAAIENEGKDWLTPEVMEALADIEHKRWASWQKHAFNQCHFNADGTATIPAWAVENWTRQIQTDYADLTEKEKESDRREVRGYLPTIQQALAPKPTQAKGE